eukprot:PLAT8036.1.p1 GENE.PLAT8036.1~~PLAT8036.1.p1  ORF type:complete len:144 (-),score=55.91 PLAT8036.1:137-547(-)
MDEWDDLLTLEDDLVAAGEKEGRADGRLRGLQEGRSTGRLAAAELTAELGMYQGSVLVWRELIDTGRLEASARAVKNLEKLEARLKELVDAGLAVEDEDWRNALEAARSKWTALCSLLSCKPALVEAETSHGIPSF